MQKLLEICLKLTKRIEIGQKKKIIFIFFGQMLKIKNIFKIFVENFDLIENFQKSRFLWKIFLKFEFL